MPAGYIAKKGGAKAPPFLANLGIAEKRLVFFQSVVSKLWVK